MDTFSNFNENSKLVSAKKDLLSKDNFEAYIAEHGSERFEGYKDALIQMLSFIHDNVLTYVRQDTTFDQKSSGVKKELILFYNERLQFLEDIISQNNSSNEYPEPHIT